MTTTPKPPRYMEREYVESRTPEEDPDADDLEEVRRQLGWDLLPFNGTVPEVPD